MHVFQALKDIDKILHRNLNQLDPLDVELKARWVYLSLSLSPVFSLSLSFSICFQAVCFLK